MNLNRHYVCGILTLLSLLSFDVAISFTAETEGEDLSIVVEGVLVPGGVECQLFQGDDSKQYSLVGDMKGFKNGDHVKITGKRVEISFCMKGETLFITEIEKVVHPY